MPAGYGTAITAATAGIGFVLIAIGLLSNPPRGRKRCPRCGYDLAALMSVASGPSWAPPVCPECGHQARTARKLLHWRRRRLPLRIGLLCLLVGAFVFSYFDGPDRFVKHAPRIWVIKALPYLGSERRQNSRVLASRLDIADYSDQELLALANAVARLLDRQDQLDQSWAFQQFERQFHWVAIREWPSHIPSPLDALTLLRASPRTKRTIAEYSLGHGHRRFLLGAVHMALENGSSEKTVQTLSPSFTNLRFDEAVYLIPELCNCVRQNHAPGCRTVALHKLDEVLQATPTEVVSLVLGEVQQLGARAEPLLDRIEGLVANGSDPCIGLSAERTLRALAQVSPNWKSKQHRNPLTDFAVQTNGPSQWACLCQQYSGGVRSTNADLSEHSLRALMQLLNHQDPAARQMASDELGRLGSLAGEAADRLHKLALHDPDRIVQMAASTAELAIRRAQTENSTNR